MSGWIKLHRKIIDKGFYSKDSEKVHLWIHLLIKANREPREEYLGRIPIICKSGQFTCGRKQLSIETGICESKIERILTYFEKIEHQIEQQKTSKNRLISICSWGQYQSSEQQSEQQVNNNRTTSEQQVNTLQEYKEVKEYKEKDIFNFKKSVLSLGVSENIIDDWLSLRKSKKASNTQTAFNSIKSQIEKSGLSANNCIEIAVIKSWVGFEAKWLNNIDYKSLLGNNVVERKVVDFDKLADDGYGRLLSIGGRYNKLESFMRSNNTPEIRKICLPKLVEYGLEYAKEVNEISWHDKFKAYKEEAGI